MLPGLAIHQGVKRYTAVHITWFTAHSTIEKHKKHHRFCGGYKVVCRRVFRFAAVQYFAPLIACFVRL